MPASDVFGLGATLYWLLTGIAPFAAPKPFPDLSAATPHGAWAATLLSSLFAVFALACSIPMRRPDPSPYPIARSEADATTTG